GAAQVKQKLPESVAIFILPPSRQELERRLRDRGQDSDEEIARRLAKARDEIAQFGKYYDFCVVNEDVERAGREVQAIVIALRCTSARRRAAMRITLGVTGGVAAYKAAELVRRLQQDGFSVQVVMTRGAREFVTPLTFAALSGQKVITDLFSDSSGGEANLESAIEHIAVAQRTDLLLVAPATADIIAKFARGIADDFLTTLYL